MRKLSFNRLWKSDAIELVGELTEQYMRARDANRWMDVERRLSTSLASERMTLPNGFVCLVNRRRTDRTAALNLCAHAGARHDPQGQSGLAHLLEHLLYSVRAEASPSHAEVLESLGAVGVNAHAAQDYSTFHAILPVESLPKAIEAEAARWRNFPRHLTQTEVVRQRAIVIREIMQRKPESALEKLLELARQYYPPNHPYARNILGSPEEVEALVSGCVGDFFNRFYGAVNLLLVVSGDVLSERLFEKVRACFGELPAGTPSVEMSHSAPTQLPSPCVKLSASWVSQPQILSIWRLPGWPAEETALFCLLSRLINRCASEATPCASVHRKLRMRAQVQFRELESQLVLTVCGASDVSAAELERAFHRCLVQLLDTLPGADEMESSRAAALKDVASALDRLDGREGRARWLAEAYLFAGTEAALPRWINTLATASASEVLAAARRWLARDALVHLVIEPRHADSSNAGRPMTQAVQAISHKPPSGSQLRSPSRPAPGLPRILARRCAGSALARAHLVFGGGTAAEPITKSGLSSLCLGLLSTALSAPGSHSAAKELAQLGAQVTFATMPDYLAVRISAPIESYFSACSLVCKTLLEPEFSESRLEKLREAAIRTVYDDGRRIETLALRTLPQILFAAGHPYRRPLSGGGVADGVRSISLEDVQEFYRTRIRTAPLSIVAVSDLAAEQMFEAAAKVFSDWSAADSSVSSGSPPTTGRARAPGFFIIPDSRSDQALVLGAAIVPPAFAAENAALSVIALAMANLVTSRLNLNLREKRQWSYGVRIFHHVMRQAGIFIVAAEVPNHKIGPTLDQLWREFEALAGPRPIATSELGRCCACFRTSLRWQRSESGRLAQALERAAGLGLAPDYPEQFLLQVERLTSEAISEVAKAWLAPDTMSWAVAGDPQMIEKELAKSNLRPSGTIEKF